MAQRLRIATWNVKSWNKKDQEIVSEIEERKIDVCALSETKRKGAGTVMRGNYLLLYKGANKNERAYAGVGILIHKNLVDNITDIKYISERMLLVELNLGCEKLNLISVYAPDTGRAKQERDDFYRDLQKVIDTIPVREKLIMLGDWNARVGDSVVPGVKNRFNEPTLNDSGRELVEFCSVNELRINNTFFDHPRQHKITYTNSRGQTSMIDYVISNRQLHPQQVLDVRTLSSANAGTDHGLVLCELRLSLNPVKRRPVIVQKLCAEKLSDLSIRGLYRSRLRGKLESPPSDSSTADELWQHIKSKVLEAAEEAVGWRKVNKNRMNNRTPWFCDEVKEAAKIKKEAFLKYKSNPTPQEHEIYARIRNATNEKITKIKENYWEGYTKGMERDFYGAQRKMWGALRNQRKEICEYKRVQHVDKEQWFKYFSELYDESNTDSNGNLEFRNEDSVNITLDMVTRAIHRLKLRKSPGPDSIGNEFLKYGGGTLAKHIHHLFSKILQEKKVPDEWKDSHTIPIFKKGNKLLPENYRGITLLNTCLKLFTTVIKNILEEIVDAAEEQQGFRRNRGTTDAIFMIRQLSEKAIEFNKPLFLCFVDLEKAFDRVRKQDVLQILNERNVPRCLIELVKDLNTNTRTQIITAEGLSDAIVINKGVRQGDSLSAFLFNLVMDKLIRAVRPRRGYTLRNRNINIICYADDAVLIADSEDELQRILHTFNMTAKKYNMKVSAAKTKSMVVSRNPIRCKLEVDGKMIEQVMEFKYLGALLTSAKDLGTEVRDQALKAARVAGCLNEMVWRNKYMARESKVRVYKTIVRPVLTFATETRAETKRTKQQFRTVEMKVLRKIAGFTLWDHQTNESIRDACNVQDVAKWTRMRRKMWSEHVDRMDEERLAKVCMTGQPIGKRLPGRPPKRWAQSWLSSPEDD